MTKRGTTLPTLFAACALALIAVGCGVDAKSDGSSGTTPTTVQVPDTASSGTVTVPDDTTTEPDDTTTEPEETTTSRPTGTTLPAGLEDTFRDSLEQGFKTAGLNDAQAKCLADGYLEKFGTDVGSSTDQTKMLGLFAECDINPADLGGG